ncbi:MAG TPA: ATP-binding protein, partial [Chloroflexota bacterium]
MPVKGLPAPIEVFELLGAGQSRTRLQAAAARGLTRFVGRQAELETLRRALELASRGHGQIVAVVGEPGVGKSRLFWELTHSHRTDGWLVLESSSVSYGRATAYLPVIDLLKSYCAIEGRDDAQRIREKVIGKLLGLDRALEPLLPPLLALLDVPAEDPAWEALDPPQRRRRTLDALRRLFVRESQRQPLMLVNYRPEYRHGWGSKTYYAQLRIDPLPPESAGELLQALLGGDEALEPLRRLLLERTGGNPFFLEESV